MTTMASPPTSPADRGRRFSSGFWQLLWMIRGYFGLMGLAIVAGIVNQGTTITTASTTAVADDPLTSERRDGESS